MLPPDAEERFRRIEDNLVVTAELQRRGEARLQEEMAHLKAIQDAMARWMDGFEDRQKGFEERQKEFEVKLNALTDAQIRSEEEMRQMRAETREMKAETREMKAAVAQLSLTVDRYLKARTNGGGT